MPINYGYFLRRTDSQPEKDLSDKEPCPICHQPIFARPAMRIVLFGFGDTRLYFYMVHIECFARLSVMHRLILDKDVIDQIEFKRSLN